MMNTEPPIQTNIGGSGMPKTAFEAELTAPPPTLLLLGLKLRCFAFRQRDRHGPFGGEESAINNLAKQSRH